MGLVTLGAVCFKMQTGEGFGRFLAVIGCSIIGWPFTRQQIKMREKEVKSMKYGTIAAAALMLMSGIGAGTEAFAQKTLRIGNTGEPATLDPHGVTGVWENRPVGELFNGLLTEDAAARSVPGAAVSWTLSDDGRTYTFKLRPGATWSDGQPVTAGDFVYAFRRIIDPVRAAKYASILYPIQNAAALNGKKMEGLEKLGVREVAPDTLEITLENPTSYFLDLLTHYTTFPVPKHVVEKHGNDWIKPGNIVSNGPYILKEWTPNTQIVMEKNQKYYDAANVKIEKIIFIPNEDRSATLRQFRANELDWVTDFPSDQIDLIKQSLSKEVRIAPYLGIYYFALNSAKAPLSDLRIRQALSLAVDRTVITDRVLRTGEIPAISFVPPGLANYEPATVPGFTEPQADRDSKALELLRLAGYGPDKPLKLSLSYNTSENHRRIAVAIAAMWKKLGVDTELANSDVAVHYDTMRQGNYQVGRAGWIGDYPDPQNFLFLYQDGNPQNYAKFSSPEFEDLMKQASRTVDPVERGKLYQKAEGLALSSYVNIPIYYYVSKNLVSQKIEGYQDNTKDSHRVRWMSLN